MRRITFFFLMSFCISLYSLSFSDIGLPPKDRLKSCDPRIALKAAKEILADPKTLNEPLEMFSPALILYQNGEKNDAVFWFYAARLRTRYQLAFKNEDRGQLLQIMLMTVGPPINNYAFQNTSNLNQILDKVLAWDKTTPNPLKNESRTSAIDQKIDNIYTEMMDLKIKLVAEKFSLEEQAKKAAPQMERTYGQLFTRQCVKGKVDPAYARQETEKEWKLVTDFARNNPDVIRESGGVQKIYPLASSSNQGEIMAYRYEVSIVGANGKSIYPVIRVTRADDGIKFSLECISHLYLGQREAFKDVCEQEAGHGAHQR